MQKTHFLRRGRKPNKALLLLRDHLSPKRRRSAYHSRLRHGISSNTRQRFSEFAFLVAGLILSAAVSRTVSAVVRTYNFPLYWHTIVVELWFVAILVLGALFLPFRPRRYGLTAKDLSKNLFLGLGFGLTGALAATILRLKMMEAGHEELMYRFSGANLLFTITNLFTVILQELVSKGVFQSGLRRMFQLGGVRKSAPAAVILTAVVFAEFHLVYGEWVAAIAFIYGLVTGWVFEKTGSIVGISIVHFMVGLAMFHFSALA